MATTGELAKLALNPFDFQGRVDRKDALRYLAIAVVLGLLIGLPGVVVGLWLTTKEAELHAGESEYLTFQKYFFLPATIGLCSVLMGFYRAMVAFWPWIDTASALARITRMIFALLFFCILGFCVLYVIFSRS